jgi:hypothetical protein
LSPVEGVVVSASPAVGSGETLTVSVSDARSTFMSRVTEIGVSPAGDCANHESGEPNTPIDSAENDGTVSNPSDTSVATIDH